MKLYDFSEEEKNSLEQLRVPLAVYQFINKQVVTRVLSDGFCELFDFEDREKAYRVMTNDMYSTCHPDDASRVADAAYKFATEDGRFEVVYRVRTRQDSVYKLVHAIGEHVYKDSGERLAYVWYTDEGSYAFDNDPIESQIRESFRTALHQESVLKASYYDYLTGLPNLSHFLEIVDAGRKAAVQTADAPVILFVDVNGMKYFNQKYGFTEGDRLLCKVAKILAAHFNSENCSRFGQDHFAVFTYSDDIENELQQILDECSAANISLKIGVYNDDLKDGDASTVCDRAKYACDSMKGSAVSGFVYFDENMLAEMQRKQYIIDNLDRALQEKWIKVYYQPIIRTANGKVCDEEALSRWMDPERGLLPPAEFITTLEDAKLIYKLDLYVVDCVLEKMKLLTQAGLHVVPQSVNLSRSDFETCDIVDEITKRTDAAGVDRSKLTIEITESIVGSDFDFIKKQVERFRKEGFSVWMDDFGSGYSSLDVLQNIHFDLIKFDMHFMRALDSGQESKIILTELIRMAMGLGIETVCEGVETSEQAEFLRDIGCTKMQGFYFCKAVPPEEIVVRNEEGRQIGFENPKEADYYSALGRINLYDPAAVVREDSDSLKNYFDTIPMGIIESKDNEYILIRCNESYKAFMDRMFGVVMIGVQLTFDEAEQHTKYGLGFLKAMQKCAMDGDQMIVDEKIQDGSTVHALIKRIAINPVTGTAALAVVILAVVEQQTASLSYAQIADALSSDYFNLFYVDLETEDFSQYSSGDYYTNLNVEKHGKDFFGTSCEEALKKLYGPDQEFFTSSFTKENVLSSLESQGSFTLTYRLMIDGQPTYVNLKAVRMIDDDRHIIIGVSNVDTQMRERQKLMKLEEESITYARISALSDDYIAFYTVNPETLHYEEYNASDDFKELGLAKSGEDFFNITRELVKGNIHPDDVRLFDEGFSEEIVKNEIKENGIFEMKYRLMIKNVPRYVMLRAALINEKDGPKIIVGVNNIDARVRRDMEYEHDLAVAQSHANIDALTGVKNCYAFEDARKRINEELSKNEQTEFAVAVFDIRGLDRINNAEGHRAGDRYIKKACSIVCDLFKRSPVFRIGDDSFAAIAKGEDYKNVDVLLDKLAESNRKNAAEDKIVIAFGSARYEGEGNADDVYERAERAMLESKRA